jgi:hypothetical protein
MIVMASVFYFGYVEHFVDCCHWLYVHLCGGIVYNSLKYVTVYGMCLDGLSTTLDVANSLISEFVEKLQ